MREIKKGRRERKDRASKHQGGECLMEEGRVKKQGKRERER